MRTYLKIALFSFSILLFTCSNSDDSNNGGGGGGGLVAQATYRVTITGNWTAQTHPTDYPANAGFDQLYFMAHSSSSSLYKLGLAGSDGLKAYATTGDISGLNAEHIQGEDGVDPTVIAIGSDISATGTDSFTLTITPNTTLISFVARISPSPDWFVGTDSFNLANPDNTLVENMEFSLFPIDAGADGGTTYESPDDPNAGPVATISGDPFTGSNGFIQRLGSVSIERIDNN
ncbi:MAG: spondin domain-containing protein [Bacteroidia bacterium]|nr:spondin domain-containing protein [Bacteroidia bacterium]